MPSIPWKYFCLYLLFHVYGPEITRKKFETYTSLLSQEYCKDVEDKQQCTVEQIKSLVLLANDTYHSLLANVTKYYIDSGLKQALKTYFSPLEKKRDRKNLYKNPSRKENKKNVNVSIAMASMIKKFQKGYKNTLAESNSAKDIKERLDTIAYDYKNTKAFCTTKFGIDPSDLSDLIDDVARMTNMSQELQNILEKSVTVVDAESSMAENTEVTVDGKVQYILIAVYRNANNSFDIGLAVFYTYYKISSYGYQKDADQNILKNLVRFLQTDTDDADGRLASKGQDDLEAYFYGKAYQMFMNKCPALLTGFKKVQEEIKSDIYD